MVRTWHTSRLGFFWLLTWLVTGLSATTEAQIAKPDDAPAPLSPAESARRFKVPPGFRVELVASEPLVQEPSGVCWDEQGRLFVCELHGYNLEGQYDIEQLNKTGQLDRQVRRIQANERAKKAAASDTYGTIKRLTDTDGDGRMDQAQLWADRLPPCHGICPARGGIIVAGSAEVLFLADRDDDGKAEVRDVLFTGFGRGPLERSVNCPQWGLDNWVYFGRGYAGGTIHGPFLSQPVPLAHTDFRIRPDGSAIEPVVGGTHTMGFAFTGLGDRFVISTGTPGIFVAPLAWKYLARNPNAAVPSLEHNAMSDQRVYPTSQPHPWRTRRARDPGFSKYYTDRYGIQESAPNGYFTSACSPLVYQDVALPDLPGQLLACEPAQNLIHRAHVQREGSQLTLRRVAGEQQAEFLTSTDVWFHPIALSHAPDGSIWIVDFYREIIEDYSAIPRYLQQQYGLVHGKDHGRIWRLTHEEAPQTPVADMSRLTTRQLIQEVGSPHFWRRQTARRLMIEHRNSAMVADKVAPRPRETSEPDARAETARTALASVAREAAFPAGVINAMATLDGLGALTPADVGIALDHPLAVVRRQGVRLAERWLDDHPWLLEKAYRLTSDPEALVRLQLALSLGETSDARVLPSLVELARWHGNDSWMRPAILSAVGGRSGRLLDELLRAPADLNHARELLEPLCAAIAAGRDRQEMSDALLRIAASGQTSVQVACLRGFRSSIKTPVSTDLAYRAREAMKMLTSSPDAEVRTQASALSTVLRIESAVERQERLARAARDAGNIRLAAPRRLAAVEQLATERDAHATATLLDALSSSTPQLREAILNAVLGRRDRLPMLLDALEQETVPVSALSAVQRLSLLEDPDPAIRQRASLLVRRTHGASEETFRRYTGALRNQRDSQRGQQVFREKCGTCHQAHGMGVAVGPDLSAEFQRAEETILRDLLVPSETISAGYATYRLTTDSGRVFSGLLSSESPTSVTLRQEEGKDQTVLRKDIEDLIALPVSLMPENLIETVTPRDVADILQWLRRPPRRLVLLDDNRVLLAALTDGSGKADFIVTDKYSGQMCLRVTPPQRYAARINGWQFLIREHPIPGQFRFIRFAWKSSGRHGVMIELAADGAWPPADKALRRYCAGRNTTGWQSVEVSPTPPTDWTVVTRDLWRDFGEFTLTGFAPTAMGGPALFDQIELLHSLEE